MVLFRLLLCVCCAATVSACSNAGSTTQDAGAGDSGPAPFPSAVIGGSTELDAVANAPARCGQAAHVWSRDARVGSPVSMGEVTHYTASYLDGLAVTAGLAVPRSPEFDAKSATFTYVTQDRGQTVEATGIVAWPYGLPLDGPPAPVLLFLHGTQGFKDGCSLDKDAGSKVLASYFASLGYVVVAPDYLGLKANGPPTGFPHPYLAGVATAIASLDAVRAIGRTPASQMDGVLVAPKVVVVGGSQGGHAALWVDRLQPYYAGELSLLGVVATVPPADLLGECVRALTGVHDSTANVLAMLGTTSSWYGAGNRLAEILKAPWDTSIPAALAASCDPGSGIPDVMSLEEVFQPLLLTAAAGGTLDAVEPWGCMFKENGLTTTSIQRRRQDPASYGILYVTGEMDKLVTTPIQRTAFATLCNAGMPMAYLECAGAGHTKATTWALAEIVQFVDDRAAGHAFTAACTPGAPVVCASTPAP